MFVTDFGTKLQPLFEFTKYLALMFVKRIAKNCKDESQGNPSNSPSHAETSIKHEQNTTYIF